MNTIEITRAAGASQPLGRTALAMPAGRPTSQETMKARNAISAESGPRWRMRSRTVSPRKKDSPSGPVALARGHGRLGVAPPPGHGDQRVAGQDAEHHEDDHRHADERAQREDRPPEQVFPHSATGRRGYES